MEDTAKYMCPRCGVVEIPDRDVFSEIIPGTDEVPGWEHGVGFHCPSCGTRWYKVTYDVMDHWRREPTGLRPQSIRG